VPDAIVKVAIEGVLQAVLVHVQIVTTGFNDASNVPECEGAATSGGRKKKCEFPPWAPSLIEPSTLLGGCADVAPVGAT
jgi:hypothetical protein